MPIMDMLPKGDTLQIPLDAPSSFAATAGNAQVELTWTDPKDKYATPEGEVSETGDQLVSEWDHTVLVRKTGSQPAGPDDGTVVVSSSVRNQYQTAPYTDTGLTNDTLYYYGVFAYNKDGVASPGAFTNATPKAGTPLSELTEGTIIKINENGSPVEFYLAKHNYEPDLNGQGRELVVRKDCYENGNFDPPDDSDDCYAGSYGDNWANSTYKNKFSTAVQELMGTTKFYYVKTNQDYTEVGTLERAVFYLSLGELGKSSSTFTIVGTRLPTYSGLSIAQHNGAAVDQYARETQHWVASLVYQAVVTSEGQSSSAENGTDFAYFRPVFTIPSTALVTEELELVEG